MSRTKEQLLSPEERRLFEHVKVSLGPSHKVELVESIVLADMLVVVLYKTTTEWEGKEHMSYRAIAQREDGTGSSVGIIL